MSHTVDTREPSSWRTSTAGRIQLQSTASNVKRKCSINAQHVAITVNHRSKTLLMDLGLHYRLRATKAIHLEAVTELKSLTFMAAFHRFISRRM